MEAAAGRSDMGKGPRKAKPEKNLYLRGKTWYARVQVNGRDRRPSLRTSDRAEAKRRLAEILERARAERAGEVRHEKYRDAVVEWAKAGYGVRSESTKRRYQASLRMLDPSFGDLEMCDIDRKRIGEYVRTRIASGASHATVRRDLTALSRLMAHTVALGWRDDNPAREWDRSTIREFRDPITRPDLRSFEACVRTASPAWKGLLRFLLKSGFRLDVDAASLLRDQVDWTTGQVTFTTKGGRRRTRDLTPEALAELRAPPSSMATPFVFWEPGKRRLWNLSRRFADIRRKAARLADSEGWVFKPFRLHDLRHEYAIRYLKTGGPNGTIGSIYTLQRQLGHTSVKTTEIYLDFLTDEEAEVAKQSEQSRNRHRHAV